MAGEPPTSARPEARHTVLSRTPQGTPAILFLFFSNRLGCLGSLLVSAIITVVLLLVLGVL